MTCGIYILKFIGTSKVYVGQSLDIEDRFKQHLYNLKVNNGKANRKLQNAYYKYGPPILETVCECPEIELNIAEQEGFEIFDSIENGLNIVSQSFEHGGSYPGELNGRAKYSNEVYIGIFDLIVDTDTPLKDISVSTGVHKNTVYQLANGSSHRKLLEAAFPERYKILLSKVGKRSVHLSKDTLLVSPSGETIKLIGTLRSFAKTHGLSPSNIGAVVNGKAKSHKGWRLL